MAIRVLVADDHTLVREGLVKILRETEGIEVVAEAADGVEAVEKAEAHRPRVAVLDISMPRLSGIEAVRRIRQSLPDTQILALTVHDEEEYVVHMVKAGVSGYLVKDSAAAELVDAVRTLAAGKSYFGPQAAQVLAEQYRRPKDFTDPYGELTKREREVFHLIVAGNTTKEIASELGITPKTADNHRSRVMRKMGCRNTAELVRYAAKAGLL